MQLPTSPTQHTRFTRALGILGIALMGISAVWRDLGFMVLALIVVSVIALYFVFYSRSRARTAIGIVMFSGTLIGLDLACTAIVAMAVMALLPVAITGMENIAITLQSIIAYCVLVLGW